MVFDDNGVRRVTDVGADQDLDGTPFSAPSGFGYEGTIYTDPVLENYVWTMRFRAACDDFN